MNGTTEWRTEFDLLYNNIMSNQAPSINDYEASVVLTQAEEEIVVTLFTGRRLHPFESTEEVTQYLAPLVEQCVLTTPMSVQQDAKLNKNSYFFKLPDNLWFKTLERVTIADDALSCNGSSERQVTVVPVTQDEYDRTINNPFKWGNDRRVIALTPEEKVVELISSYKINSYLLRYLRRPKPIILTDLSGTGLSINGETSEQDCELHEALHRSILVRAVEIAKSIWANSAQQG